MKMLSRPKECINAGCIACCGMAEYEFYKGMFKDNAQKCPNYKRGMIPMSTIEDIKAEIKDARLNQINDETEKAVNYGLYTALAIIDKHTKGDAE